jgi:hypothetical protein
MFDTNEEVVKQINESKRVGQYQLQGFTPSDHGVFNSTLGYGNRGGGRISSRNIDSDSFLKNIHVKNSTKIQSNPIIDSLVFHPTFIRSAPINIPIKVKRRYNNAISGDDISSRFYNPNVMNLQNHINYNFGIDSRHEKR